MEATPAKLVNEQLEQLASVLHEWLAPRRDVIAEANLQMPQPGRFLLVLVQHCQKFNRRLTDDVAQFELDLAKDERFNLLPVEATIAPGPRMS